MDKTDIFEGVEGRGGRKKRLCISEETVVREQKLFDFLFGMRLPFTYSGNKCGQELLVAKHEHKLQLQLLAPLVRRWC